MTPADFRAIRKQAGLSAEKMAQAVGVASGRTVRRWEAGDMAIAPHIVVRARRLQLRDRYLLATDCYGNHKFVIRIAPPGFIMQFNGGIAAWLDPPPESFAEVGRMKKEARAYFDLMAEE